MIKRNICGKIILVVILLSTVLILCRCSYPGGDAIASASARNKLSEAIKTAAVYTQFLNNEENASADLLAEIDNAKKIKEDVNSSGGEINSAAAALIESINIFREFYFNVSGEKTKDADLIKNLTVGNVKCAYDKKSRTFYYTMGKTTQKIFEFYFTITSGFDKPASDDGTGGNKTAVFAEILDGNGNVCPYSFVPELNKEYTLRAYSAKFAFDYKIIFTILPVVQISGINRINDDYRDCVISVTDPDFPYMESVVSNLFVESTAKIKLRGGISRGFPKQAYSLKFVGDSGENKDIPFFDMRGDSDWILDAMYIDRARARNRVSTDIWNAMDSPLYYMSEASKPQTNGTNGEFVEVFLNDEYIGLYCFTEKIDRKQLQLLKNNGGSVQSAIYKGKAWGQSLLFKSLSDYSTRSSWWDAFEQKYPNPYTGGEIKWEPLYNFVKFFLESSDEEFAANVNKYIDVRNFAEYALLMCISYAYDNTGKNAYWSVYDVTDENMSKIFLTPWDLDSTWGRSWNGEKVESSTEWMDSSIEHDTALFRRLVLTNAGGFADILRQRWSDLKSNVLSVESIVGAFNEYFTLFNESGAWAREKARWPESGLDMKTEIEYIKKWTKERWNYINNIIMNELDTVDKFAPVERRRRW